jgi:hypothetical protein
MNGCGFQPCGEVEECALIGGCINRPGHKHAKLGAAPKLSYNTATGGRYDLEVKPGDETDNIKWLKKRATYLRELLAGELSADARSSYERELKIIVDKKSDRA